MPATPRPRSPAHREDRRPRTALAALERATLWITLNDEPTDLDPASVAGLISVQLVADTFGVDPRRLARIIVRHRRAALGPVTPRRSEA